jgi:hypothetical protein
MGFFSVYDLLDFPHCSEKVDTLASLELAKTNHGFAIYRHEADCIWLSKSLSFAILVNNCSDLVFDHLVSLKHSQELQQIGRDYGWFASIKLLLVIPKQDGKSFASFGNE